MAECGACHRSPVGPESASFRTAWTGWTVPELFALNRYRVRAQ